MYMSFSCMYMDCCVADNFVALFGLDIGCMCLYRFVIGWVIGAGEGDSLLS